APTARLWAVLTCKTTSPASVQKRKAGGSHEETVNWRDAFVYNGCSSRLGTGAGWAKNRFRTGSTCEDRQVHFIDVRVERPQSSTIDRQRRSNPCFTRRPAS